MCGFHVCLLSTDIGIMIACTIYVAVYEMTRCGYIFSNVLILLNCLRVSTFRLWIHLVLETSWFCSDWLLLGPRLVSDILSCDPMYYSKSSSFLVSVFLLFGASYWLGCYLHLHSYKIAVYLHVTISPFPCCCNSHIFLVIQLFDKFPKLLIISYNIQSGCFGFSLKLLAYACRIWPTFTTL